jgi:hypothetical protein
VVVALGALAAALLAARARVAAPDSDADTPQDTRRG